MLIKLMGVLDLFVATVLILSTFNLIGWKIVLLCAMYLFIKGFAFKGNFVSWLDMGIAVYLLITIFAASTLLSWGSFAYLGIKGLQSIMV